MDELGEQLDEARIGFTSHRAYNAVKERALDLSRLEEFSRMAIINVGSMNSMVVTLAFLLGERRELASHLLARGGDSVCEDRIRLINRDILEALAIPPREST